MSLHGDWKKIKAKLKKAPKSLFVGADFGKKLDAFEAAEKALEKNQDDEKEDKLKEKTKTAILAVVAAQKTYLEKTLALRDDAETSPEVKAELVQLLKDWVPLQKGIDTNKKRYGR